MRRALALALALAACSAPAEPLSPEPEEAPAGAARWEAPLRPSDRAVLEHPARVVAAASARGEVGAPFRARVLRVHVQAGSRVEEGDAIVDVAMPEVLDAAAAVVGLGRRIAAHRERARELEALRTEQLVDSARVFEQRAALAALEDEHARALAVLRAASLGATDARRALSAGAITLRAPTGGVVRTLDAPLGETREAGGAPFARVVGEGAARVEVRSTEPLAAADTLTFAGEDGAIVALAREPIARVVDPEDGMHVTWLAPSEPVALADGLRGRVRLALDAPDVWEVAASSLLVAEDGARLVVRRGGAIERVPARVVASSGATAIVRAALAESDRVAAAPGALEAP